MDRHFDEKPLFKLFNKERLCDTNIDEYTQFFETAARENLIELKTQLK